MGAGSDRPPQDGPSAEESAGRRAAARRTWNVRRTDLVHADDDLPEGTPASRVLLVWPLMLEAWRVSGRPLPTFRRDQMPGVVWRAGQVPPEHVA